MNVLIYGSEQDKNTFALCVSNIAELQYRVINYQFATEPEQYARLLKENSYDLITVLADGANGMEGVMAASEACLGTPIAWISNDEGFGFQAQRLGCIYFALKPLSDDKIIKLYKAYQGASV